jgi:16S rRNA (cytosine1402-N4)-methyltransferase
MLGESRHVTVLLHEAVDALTLQSGATAVDATLGAAGHTRLIADAIGAEGTLIALDADAYAVNAARDVLSKRCREMHLVNRNFRELREVLGELGIEHVDAILADLGWRQEQFGGAADVGGGKGFSFRMDEPLRMTYGDPENYPFTAYDIANTWERDSIIAILRGYGEERHAFRIAEAIVAARETGVIETTAQLVEIIERSVPASYRHGPINPATRTFQAMRIAVNDELGVLETFIGDAVSALAPKGRLAIITFHSLEDRIVKHRFRTYANNGEGTVITKRPITPSDTEVMNNPRARSAKLRVFEKH